MDDSYFSASASIEAIWKFANNEKVLRITGRKIDYLVSDGNEYPAISLEGDVEQKYQATTDLMKFWTEAIKVANSCAQFDPDHVMISLCLACSCESCLNRQGRNDFQEAICGLSNYIELIKILEPIVARVRKIKEGS